MSSRFCEEGEDRREDKRRHKQDTDNYHVWVACREGDRQMIEQPDGNDE